MLRFTKDLLSMVCLELACMRHNVMGTYFEIMLFNFNYLL